MTVSAGNTAPVAVIDAPGSTLTWKVDDQIAFSGHATDAQEGALPASALSWSLILHHCPSGCHTHVIQTMDGIAGGSFLAPDHGYPAYLELRLTATDSEGAQSTTNVRLDPQTVTVELRSDPPGLVLALGSTAQPAPFTKHRDPRLHALGERVVAAGPCERLLPLRRLVGRRCGVTPRRRARRHQLHGHVRAGAGRPAAHRWPRGSDGSVPSGAGFVLDGSGSTDPQGQPLSYHWEQVSGPAAVLRDQDEARATVDGVRGPATLTFRLTVTDTAGQTDSDEVTVTVARPK